MEEIDVLSVIMLKPTGSVYKEKHTLVERTGLQLFDCESAIVGE
jgi:uncharacterized protein YccT (UPF0319 family)